MRMPRQDLSDIAGIVNAALNASLTPLMDEMRSLKLDVKQLNVDRVTRADLEKLRSEFVLQANYEPRHTALIERDTLLSNALKELREEFETDIEELRKNQKEQHAAELSDKDRSWVRWSQIAALVSIIITVIGLLLQYGPHIHVG